MSRVLRSDDPVATYFANGGQVTACKTKKPRSLRSPERTRTAQAHPTSKIDRKTLLERLQGRFEALRDEFNAPKHDVDWWAAFEANPSNPLGAIADAASVFVIARDEGVESSLLYEKALCWWSRYK